MSKLNPVHIDVFGSNLCHLRSKLASAIASQASVEGRRVLLTERDSSQLSLSLPSNLISNGKNGLALFTLDEVPSHSYLIALAPKWNKEAEKRFEALAQCFDVVVCSHGTLLGSNANANSIPLLAGSFDGLIRAESIELSTQLNSAPFVAAVPHPEPLCYAQSIAKAQLEDKHLAEIKPWLLPLYSHQLFAMPQAAELEQPLWQKTSQLIAALELPPGTSRTKPDSNLLARAHPVFPVNNEPLAAPSPPSTEIVAQLLSGPDAHDEQLAKRLRSYTSNLRSKLEGQRQNSEREIDQLAKDSSAARNQRTQLAKDSATMQAEQYQQADAKLVQEFDANASRNANLAKQLRIHLEAKAEQTGEKRRTEIADIKQGQIALQQAEQEGEARIIAEAEHAEHERIKAQEEAERAERERIKAQEEAERTAHEEAAVKLDGIPDAKPDIPTHLAKPPESGKAKPPATKLVGRTITRISETKFTHYIDHEEIASVLEPQPVEQLYSEAIKAMNVKPPEFDTSAKSTDQFVQLRNYYFKKLTSKARQDGGSYICALFALRLAERVHGEDRGGTQERVLREFVNEMFDNARNQEKEFPLAHWFLNLAWVIEHKLHTGDLNHVLKLGGNLIGLLFSTKPGVNSKLSLQVMRALLSMLVLKLEQLQPESDPAEITRGSEIVSRMFDELPPGLHELLLYSGNKEEDQDTLKGVEAAIVKAKQSFGAMLDNK